MSSKGKHWKRPDTTLPPQCQTRPCPKHGPRIRTKKKWRCVGCEEERQFQRKLAGTAPGYGPRKKRRKPLVPPERHEGPTPASTRVPESL